MATMQTVLDLARLPLNDSAKDRYTDADLLTFAIHGLLVLFRKRPDLFLGSYTAAPSLSLAAGSTFPLTDQYISVLADYVTARAESLDNEVSDSGRAATFYQLFAGG